MIKPKLHHITMKTTHLDEMIAWYALVISAKVQFRDKMAAWTTNDAANHRIAFLAVPGLSDDADKVRHNGMHHCAFEYDSFADLMASFDRLRQAGVEPVFCLDHGMTISLYYLYYKDPEANFVELQSDSFSDWNPVQRMDADVGGFCPRSDRHLFRSGAGLRRLQSGIEFKALHQAVRGGAYLPDPIPNIGLPTP